MKQIFIFFFLVIIFKHELPAQSNKEIYKFSNDIISIIDKDTVPWKYQTGATEFSFSGFYKNSLETWDKVSGGRQDITSQDSLYFNSFKPINAKKYILNRSKKEQVIIINEAHYNSSHRVFTTSLLQGLYEQGYRFLGLEAIFDTLINIRKYPILESGYYTKESQFGNLIYEAIKIGFTIFGYEASENKNGKDREIEQAENISKLISKNPKSKFLIHCGYDHVIEGTPSTKSWIKAMAGRLKEITKIDPFTIDQTKYSEKGELLFNSPYIQMVNSDYPVIMVDANGKLFNGGVDNDQTDCNIIHPVTKFINGRPNWLTLYGSRINYTIPISKLTEFPVLVFAYRNSEFEQNGIPADIIEINSRSQNGVLILDKGNYKIIIKDKNYKIVNEYLQKIN